MPFLAGLLANGFAGVVGFLAAFVSKKVAVGAALAAFMIAGWVTLQVSLLALWVGLAYSTPVSLQGALAVAAYLMPSNFASCVQIIVLAKIGRWLWDRQREWANTVALA